MNEEIVQGIVSAVSVKNGGIKIGENWYNPVKEEYKEFVTADLKGKELILYLAYGLNNKFSAFQKLKVDDNKVNVPITPDKKEELKEDKSSKSSRKDGHIIILQGKEYITHAGLLDKAHKLGLYGISTEIIENSFTEQTAIVRAKVLLRDKNRPEEVRTFTAYGDASPKNLNRMMQPSYLRMAETRSINRALRFATNIGMCSVEELPSEKEDDNNATN